MSESEESSERLERKRSRSKDMEVKKAGAASGAGNAAVGKGEKAGAARGGQEGDAAAGLVKNWCLKRTMCQYHEEGKCKFGARCGFAHHPSEMGQEVLDPMKVKNELCKNYARGHCRFTSEDCLFAHGLSEMGMLKKKGGKLKGDKGGSGKDGKGKVSGGKHKAKNAAGGKGKESSAGQSESRSPSARRSDSKDGQARGKCSEKNAGQHGERKKSRSRSARRSDSSKPRRAQSKVLLIIIQDSNRPICPLKQLACLCPLGPEPIWAHLGPLVLGPFGPIVPGPFGPIEAELIWVPWA